MPRFFSWLVAALPLAGFVVVAALVLRERADAGRDLPPYSIYSDAGDGLGEVAHILPQLGVTPVAVRRPPQQTQLRGLLIVVQPAPVGALEEEGLTESDATALLNWVEEGNTLLLCGDQMTPLHRTLEVEIVGGPRDEEAFTPVVLSRRTPYTEDVQRLSVSNQSVLRASGGTVLWRVGKPSGARPGALLLRRGKGRVVVVADPGLLTRRGLVEPDGQPRDDNVMFLYNVVMREARGGVVYFDEYHHGFQAGTGFWGYLAYYNQRWLLLPILLVVAAAAWAWGVRLGPAVPAPRPVRADAVDYAAALGRLYRRAGARRLPARALARGFLTALTRHLRLRRTALPAEILAAWGQHRVASAAGTSPTADPSYQQLQALLRGVSELRRGEVSERQLLAWARAFDAFTAEIERLEGGRRK